MDDAHTDLSADQRFKVRATAESHFSWIRTRLSLERTLMGWVRTAVSLIGFGFTIVQFFNRLQDMSGTKTTAYPLAPYLFGLALIFCGVLALVVSIWQYHWGLRYLWRDFAAIAGAKEEPKKTPLVAVAGALAVVGVAAFFAVLLHIG